MMKLIKKFIAPIVPLIIVGCVSPTFESVSVKKGSRDWIGILGGYRSFDHNETFYVDGNNEVIDTRGIVGSIGRDYGFTENIGIVWQGALYYYYYTGFSDDHEYRSSRIFPTGSLCLKFEPTRPTSRVAFSISTGPAFPELVKTTLMVGLQKNARDVIWLGSHIGFYLPYDVFVNVKPFSNIGIILYTGYRLPLPTIDSNRFNIAGRIGYRF